MSSYYEKFLVTGEVKCIDEEILFEIPKNWCWVRLGDILTVKGGKRIPLGDTFAPTPTAHIYIRVTEMKNHTLVDTNLKYISDAVYEKIKNYTISKNDLYLTIAGTIGSVGVVPEKFDGMNLTENAVKLTNIFIDKWFLVYAISSQLVQTQFVDKTKQMAQPKLAIERIQTTIMPLPPYDEQKRIVAKVEELMPILEKYNKSQTNLDRLNNGICSLLSKSILQEAIQGKLVQQIAEEGTAQELIEQIRQEKQKLVKEGKLKKSALTDSVIFKGDDNKYYEQTNNQVVQIECDCDFPDNWAIARLSSICTLVDGEKKDGQQICLDAKYLRGKSTGDYLQKGRFVQRGDSIILVDGENSGEVFTVPCDGYMGSTFKQLWVSSVVYLPYVLNFILFYKELLRKSKRGAAIPHLNKEIFYSLIIGIPPYQEQVRIVNKINELFAKIKG